MIKKINNFVNGTSQQLDYLNFEGDLYLYIFPNKATRLEVLNGLKEHCEYYKECIEEVENTPEQLEKFANEMNREYLSLVGNKIKFL